MTDLALLLDAGAVYRVTRLVTKDTLTQRTRDRLIIWSYLRGGLPADQIEDDHPGTGTVQAMTEADLDAGETATDSGRVPFVAAVIVCRWCAGVWVAAGVAAARWAVPAEWNPVAWGLTIAAAAPLLARLES